MTLITSRASCDAKYEVDFRIIHWSPPCPQFDRAFRRKTTFAKSLDIDATGQKKLPIPELFSSQKPGKSMYNTNLISPSNAKTGIVSTWTFKLSSIRLSYFEHNFFFFIQNWSIFWASSADLYSIHQYGKDGKYQTFATFFQLGPPLPVATIYCCLALWTFKMFWWLCSKKREGGN